MLLRESLLAQPEPNEAVRRWLSSGPLFWLMFVLLLPPPVGTGIIRANACAATAEALSVSLLRFLVAGPRRAPVLLWPLLPSLPPLLLSACSWVLVGRQAHTALCLTAKQKAKTKRTYQQHCSQSPRNNEAG
jgi:hypothetical protein